MYSTGLLLVMGLVMSLGLILNRHTNGAPVLDDLDSPSVFKEVGGLAEFTYAWRELPRQMPPTLNMSRQERIEWVKKCELYGSPCEFAEQCCTRICLVDTMECSAPAAPINNW